MPSIQILNTGRLDERESAFPQAVQLPDGDILCSFGVGGGQFVHGGTDWVRSTDGGLTWWLEGQLLPPTSDPPSANFLKLSLSSDGQTIYAYGTRYWGSIDDKFGERRGEALFCVSTDNGHSWSSPQVIPMPDVPLEVSHSILPLASGRNSVGWDSVPTADRGSATQSGRSPNLRSASGRLLAPTGLLVSKERLGEEVIVAVSDDGGRTWPSHRTVFKDPAGKLGFWEQKLAEIAPNEVLAVAWTITLGDYHDQPNSFAISRDAGWTWGPIQSTGIRGQTMTPLPLGGDRLLVLYNRRYGAQGIVAALATFTDTTWSVHHEQLFYDARAFRDGPSTGATGVDELASFQFGFPTAIRLRDGTFLSTHWCVEQGVCGIRWTKFSIEWC
jgi:hypothetical protein